MWSKKTTIKIIEKELKTFENQQRLVDLYEENGVHSTYWELQNSTLSKNECESLDKFFSKYSLIETNFDMEFLKEFSKYSDKKVFDLIVYIAIFEKTWVQYNYWDVLDLYNHKSLKSDERIRELFLLNFLALYWEHLQLFNKESLEAYMPYLSKTKEHIEQISSLTELNQNWIELSETGKARNLVYDTIADMANTYNFLFDLWQWASNKYMVINMKSLNNCMKNKDFILPNYKDFVLSSPQFQKWISSKMTNLTEKNEDIYILWYTLAMIYPYFHKWENIKSISPLLKWVDNFMNNYKELSMNIQIAIFWLLGINKKTNLRRFEVGIFYDKNKKDIETIINYVEWDIEEAKKLIDTISQALKNKKMVLSLQNIVKHMYNEELYKKKVSKWNKRKSISSSNSIAMKMLEASKKEEFPKDFLEDMKKRKVPKMFYLEYYQNEYLPKLEWEKIELLPTEKKL